MTIKRINNGKGHWYKIDGQKADGVTTLIKGGLPAPALIGWGIRSVAEYAADHLDELNSMRPMGRNALVAALRQEPFSQRDGAAARGTVIHHLADDLMHGREVTVPPELAGYVESCVRFLDDTGMTPVATEFTVAHRKWNYCGTGDVVGRLSDERVIIVDYKTAKSGIFGEVALQLAAYAHAEVWLDGTTERPMTDLGIVEGMAVWIRPDGYTAYPVDISGDVFNAFLHVAWVARMRETRLDGWVGDPHDFAQPTSKDAA